VRRLIVNADDFGLTSGVNRGILQAHQHGIVSCATLMACGSRFEEAVALAREAPSLTIGCHVVLVDGVPVLEGGQVASLVDGNPAPRFRDSLMTFACLAAAGRLDQSQIEAEVTAQIRKLQAAGIPVYHLDSHKHTHMFPAVLKAVLRAARNCGVRAIRNPFEPLVFASLRQWKRQFQLKLLQRFRAHFRELLAEAGVVTTDGCVGIAATGGLNLQTLCGLVENLPEGTWEFVSHPGYNDPDLARVRTRLRDSREKELEILTSAAVKDLLRREQVQIISYRELVEGPRD